MCCRRAFCSQHQQHSHKSIGCLVLCHIDCWLLTFGGQLLSAASDQQLKSNGQPQAESGCQAAAGSKIYLSSQDDAAKGISGLQRLWLTHITFRLKSWLKHSRQRKDWLSILSRSGLIPQFISDLLWSHTVRYNTWWMMLLSSAASSSVNLALIRAPLSAC